MHPTLSLRRGHRLPLCVCIQYQVYCREGNECIGDKQYRGYSQRRCCSESC
jgi:hypothetical protein